MSLPGWLEPLPDAARMRATDAWAISEQGVPSLDLMERAGFGLAGLAARRAPEGRVVVLCGKGNNGGDGLVAARLLRDDGREVDVLLMAPAQELTGDPAANLERLSGLAPRPFEAGALDGASVVIDALLGTGFEGEPREPVAGAIAAINATRDAGAEVVAADVPSGVDASTGEVAGAAVRASATATFHAAKPGLWIAPGKTHAGEVHVIEIGIPRGAPADADVGLIGAALIADLPTRAAGGTKFSSGAVLVCGGSLGLTGAPCLSSEGAMRAGAGYVTALVPASLNLVFEQRLLEVMTRPLPDHEGALTPAAAERVLETAERGDALVVGPGFGRTDGALALARDLAARAPIPLVLDADGLNAHAGALASLASRGARPCSRRTRASSGACWGSPARRSRRGACTTRAPRPRAPARSWCSRATTRSSPGPTAWSPSIRARAPALATAGTGDVLSGVIAALLARGVEPFTAACAAVHLHAEAGRVAAERRGVDGMIASDVIDALPDARARLLERGR